MRSRGCCVLGAADSGGFEFDGRGCVGGELCSAEYWVRHVREPVRFADGVRWLVEQGVGGFSSSAPMVC